METTRVTVDGSGDIGELGTWSVSENATPVAPGDPAAASGGVQFEAQADENSDFLTGDSYTLTDENYGTVSGAITRADVGILGVSATGDNLITRLSAVRTVPPALSAGHETLWETANLNQTQMVTADSAGNVYIAGPSPSQIRKYTPSGVFVTSLSVPNGQALSYDEVNNRLVYFGESFVSYIPTTLASITSTFTNSNYVLYGLPVFHGPSQRFVGTYRQLPDSGFNLGIFSFPANFGTPVTVTAPNTNAFTFGWGARLYGEQASEILHIAVPSNNALLRYINPVTGAITTSKTLEMPSYFPGADLAITNIATTSAPQAVVGTTLELYVSTAGGFVNGDATNEKSSIHRIGVYGRADGFAIIDSWRHPSETAVGTAMRPRSMSVSGDLLYVTSQNLRAYELRNERTVALSAVFQSYLDALNAGLTLDYQATEDPYIAAPGWSDSVWTKLNELCVAHNVEIGIDEGAIVVRDIGTGTLETEDFTPISRSISAEGASRFVDVQYTNATAGVGTVYDAATDGQGRTFDISPGEFKTEILQTQNYPVALQSLIRTQEVTVSGGAYFLSAADNLPVAANQLEAFGGSVTATINPDIPGAIDLNIRGPIAAIPGVPAPYRIAVSDGSTAYPALKIVGIGVFTNPEIVRLSTGADWSRVTTSDSSSALSNSFISTRAQAFDRGAWSAFKAAGPNSLVTLSVSYENSNGFGLTAGSTFRYRDAIWRVESVSFNAMSVQVTASYFTRVGDFEARWGSSTVYEVEDFWQDYSVKDTRIRPLMS